MLDDFNPDTIQDLPAARAAICHWLNLVESIAQENRALKAENQSLRDEINRLKGEQGKPDIKPQKAPATAPPHRSVSNHSSETERQEPGTPWKKSAKIDRLVIHETKILGVDPQTLPPDAEFKGYDEVIVQDLIFRSRNTCFRKEKYYSPSTRLSFVAPLPPGYQGEFGPGIKALAITLAYESNVSQPKIRALFTDIGLLISAGQLCRFLSHDLELFHQEKAAILDAGLSSTSWQHLDDTGTRVKGENWYCQILCNPFYTAYLTTPGKSRLDVLAALTNGRPLSFLLNDRAFHQLEATSLPEKIIAGLHRLPQGQVFDEDQFNQVLTHSFPALGPQQRRLIGDTAAIAAYHAQSTVPIVRTLLCDDAPQFKDLTDELSLCWVHDGRHYKKLLPVVPHFLQLRDHFLDQYWDFYRQLLAYKKQPTPAEAERLSLLFDTCFATVTGYHLLDDRIAKTKAKKMDLLRVLDQPALPLHNNPAELAARQRVRKRDVSLAARTTDGIKAWDTLMTLAETAKKLAVNFHDYIFDRITASSQLPSLATLIVQKAQKFHRELPLLNSS